MKKKFNNGFTLIELLGVIVILALLLMILMPKVSQIVGRSKSSIRNQELKRILTAAYEYSITNPQDYLKPDNYDVAYVTLATLKSSGFIDDEIIDPSTKEPFSDTLTISITKNPDKTGITCSGAYLCQGDYVYHIQ